ncbi:MAG: adenosylcobinamide-GDP ribazoletransferase [Pyrinomonadaceae bacterium]
MTVQFLTRVPVPRVQDHSEAEMGKATAFFPLVGVLVGATAAAAFWLLQKILPVPTAVFGAIVFTAILTNAFHEDGLADTFDGFGGGWTKDRVLEIMRDSRVGTFGALALIFLVLGKYSLLSSLPQQQIWRWLIVAHTAARWATLPLCAWLPYARAEGQGKLVAKQVGLIELTLATITMLVALLLLPWRAAIAALIATTFITLLTGTYYKARLQGITGDCLGATNQLTEVGLYLTAVVLLRFELIQ